MPFVQCVITALQCQVEDFPETVAVEGGEPRKFERSCEGAMHVRPGASVEITADELAHLKENHPSIFNSFRILATDEQLDASRAAPTEPPPAAVLPPDEGADVDEGSKDSGGAETPSETPDAKKKSGKR